MPLSRRESLAWAAGFFDGEGHIGYHPFFDKRKGVISRKIVLTVTQVDRRTLDQFRKIMGVGTVQGPKKTGEFRYQSSSFSHVQHMMAQMWDFLGNKKRDDYRRSLAGYLAHGGKSHAS